MGEKLRKYIEFIENAKTNVLKYQRFKQKWKEIK